MRGEPRAAEACVYVISWGLERVKIGVAGDARKRLRELQVGSPVELKLAHIQPYPERRDAVAVAEELYRYFARRRVHGSWYRLTVAEVREGLSRRATLEAPARARAAEAAAREGPVAPRRGEPVRARTEKQRAYERRRRHERTRKQKWAAKLLGQRMTQEQSALAVGVTSRTLRNWQAAPAFRRELERQHKHAARPPTSTPSSERRRPLGTPKSAPSGRPQRRVKQQPVQTSSAAEPPPAAAEARPAQPGSGHPIRRPTSVALPSTAEPPSARHGFAGFLDRKDAERAARIGRAPGQPANSFLEPREWLVHQVQLAKVNRDPEREAVARQALADWDAQ